MVISLNMLKRNIYIIIIALAVLITIIPATRRVIAGVFFDTFGWLESPVSKVSSVPQRFFSGIGEISKVKDENSQLAAKLQKLKLDSSELEELKVENKILKNQLGFAEEHKEYELIGTKIIGRDPVSFMDRIIVDKGGDDGVILGAVAISDGALAGKVTEVLDHQSKVTLITSKDSIIQVMLQKSRVMGVLRGGLSGLTLENIPQDIEVKSGEGIVTSGLGGSIDQGILVGEVVGQNSSKAQIYKTLSIQPTVDFSKLELIFIIK